MSTYNLERFIKAQEADYALALSELRTGRKRSHWMWYIFPQLKCLGHSPAAKYYGIGDIGEAVEYVAHPLLRAHLIELCRVLLSLEETDVLKIFDYPDNLKLRSSMTLFALAAPEVPEFRRILDKFYGGMGDSATEEAVGASPGAQDASESERREGIPAAPQEGGDTAFEHLDAYRARTVFMEDSLPREGAFSVNGKLSEKVAPDGTFKPFYGDTVIYTLESSHRAYLAALQEELYNRCGHLLSERLPHDSFHVTLHDLLSSPDAPPCGMAENRHRTSLILANARQCYLTDAEIKCRCVFSMVGTSIVMGYEPTSEAAMKTLLKLWDELQDVTQLSYPLTLHATLAYYRPDTYTEQDLYLLRKALAELARDKQSTSLTSEALHYATFDSMSHYDLY